MPPYIGFAFLAAGIIFFILPHLPKLAKKLSNYQASKSSISSLKSKHHEQIIQPELDNPVTFLAQTILPYSLHGINPRTLMGTSKWNKLRKELISDASGSCLICKEDVSKKHSRLECHEAYSIDLNNRTFELVNVIAICTECHQYIHQGLLSVLVSKGVYDEDYYDYIIKRGDTMLSKYGLQKQDLPFSEISNSSWVLLYNGNRYSKIDE